MRRSQSPRCSRPRWHKARIAVPQYLSPSDYDEAYRGPWNQLTEEQALQSEAESIMCSECLFHVRFSISNCIDGPMNWTVLAGQLYNPPIHLWESGIGRYK